MEPILAAKVIGCRFWDGFAQHGEKPRLDPLGVQRLVQSQTYVTTDGFRTLQTHRYLLHRLPPTSLALTELLLPSRHGAPAGR